MDIYKAHTYMTQMQAAAAAEATSPEGDMQQDRQGRGGFEWPQHVGC